MAIQYIFTAKFWDSNLNDLDVNYQMSEDNDDRWEALVYCWKEAIKQYCRTEDIADILKRFNKKTRSVQNFHELNDLTLRIKDKDGKGTTLRCTGTNYYEIGCEISE